MLVASNLQKEYPSGAGTLAVLKQVSFTIPQGSLVAIVGPSGSGKTTLLGLLAGLDVPSSGTVSLDGVELNRLTEDERARLRGEKVGFIFQTFQLIPTLTALENVQVPLELRGDFGAPERAKMLLEHVGLGDRMDHFPSQLSGGEQQRVAVARALANRPVLVLADEPTGNLDEATAEIVFAEFLRLVRHEGSAALVATHNERLAARMDRVVRLHDGRLS